MGLEETYDEAAERFQDGDNLGTLVKDLKIPPGHLKRALKDRGCTVGSGFGTKPSYTVEEKREMARRVAVEGESGAAVAEDFDCHPSLTGKVARMFYGDAARKLSTGRNKRATERELNEHGEPARPTNRERDGRESRVNRAKCRTCDGRIEFTTRDGELEALNPDGSRHGCTEA